MKAKIGPVPILHTLAVMSIILSICLGYVSVSPTFVEELDPAILAFTIGLFLIGIAIYFIPSPYHRKKGLPLELSFKELPPEKA